MQWSEILGIVTAILSTISVLIVIVYRAIYLINQGKAQKSGFIARMIKEIINAEFSIQGRKKGNERLNSVMLNLGTKKKKDIKKINEIHSILNTAKSELEEISKEQKNQRVEEINNLNTDVFKGGN